ncbi:MAG: T9SS type A sorting domain-containing protein [Taibaiella sp.]|jgi:uncharacterized repeat protein (TIGR01451 family)
MRNLVKFTSVSIALLSIYANNAHGQFSINETFTNNTINNGITLGGSAALTSGTSDPQGQGWLRLTGSVNNQAGYAVIEKPFPSNMGVLIDFEYTTWSSPGDGNGADGLSVFLFDAASASSFHVGGYGGSLGYAPHNGTAGLSGGYMGIGLDEFGNYSNPTESRTGGPGFVKNVVGLRGPAPTYAYLGGNQVISSDNGSGDNGGIDYNTTTSTRPTATQFYRRVQVSLEPHDGFYTVTVKWKKSQTTPFTTLFGPVTMTSVPPAMLKLGLAASTGSLHNFHEIRNMVITTPGNISVVKQGPAYITYPGAATPLSYDITVRNQTPVTVDDIQIQDLLPAGYVVNAATGITVQDYGNTTNTVSNLAVNNGILSGVAKLASNTEITLHVNGTISNLQAGQTIRNTVKVFTSSIQDIDTTNNADTVYTMVQTPLPVNLQYFTAQKQGNDVMLDWETAMEINNDRFEIERSIDGKLFETVGTVKSLGNSSEATNYSFRDMQAALIKTGTLYYRLHQVDLDGKNDYSMIRSVSLNRSNNESGLQASPVPFKDKISVQLNSTSTGFASINFYNTSGMRIYHIETEVKVGLNEINIMNLHNLPSGVYILECVQGQETSYLKIVK